RRRPGRDDDAGHRDEASTGSQRSTVKVLRPRDRLGPALRENNEWLQKPIAASDDEIAPVSHQRSRFLPRIPRDDSSLPKQHNRTAALGVFARADGLRAWVWAMRSHVIDQLVRRLPPIQIFAHRPFEKGCWCGILVLLGDRRERAKVRKGVDER